MCDKSSFRECPSGIAPAITPPKSVGEHYAEKQRTSSKDYMGFINDLIR